jgi:hypothetical protein
MHSENIVACRLVSAQRPRDKQIKEPLLSNDFADNHFAMETI